MKYRLFIILLFLPSLVYAGAVADEIVRSDAYLSKVKGMIQKEQAAVKKLQNEKQKKARELKKAEVELRFQKKISQKLKKRLYSIRQEITLINFKMTKLTTRQEELREHIRAANYYLAGAGESEMLEALILADEITELTAGLQILSKVNANLFDKVRELDNNKNLLIENKELMKVMQHDLKSALKEQKDTQKKYNTKKTLLKQLYKMAEEDEKIKTEYISMLAKRERTLEQKLKELEIEQSQQREINRFVKMGRDFGKMP